MQCKEEIKVIEKLVQEFSTSSLSAKDLWRVRNYFLGWSEEFCKQKHKLEKEEDS